MLNNIKYNKRREAKESQSTCEKLSEMPLKEQHDTLCSVVSNQCKCLQCGRDNYYVLDTEICEDNSCNKTAICMCYNCGNMIDVIWERFSFAIKEVTDMGYLDDEK